ncbi:MFS transporter [Neoroseomonas soli]|uniref:MFS transporter n=1 Tax=Neoroseomonas soli TaxID=1081025 RepID=A0A9X9WWJ0_9PROT|nr:MFS transporter [Neoroseomonas soli]
MAGAFLVTMVGYGAIYSYAAFADEIAAEFGASRARVSLIFALSGGTALLVSAVGGPLADRIGARPTACLGMTIVALGLLTASSARSMEEVIAGYGLLIGLGVGFSYVPAVATVQCWFAANRGLASGIAVSGVGVGTALVPPFADLLTTFGNWRTAFTICAVLAMLTGICGALLLEQPPERVGLASAGRRRSRQPPPAQATAPAPVSASPLRSARFGQFYCGTMLLSVPVAIPYALVVGTAQAIGHSLLDGIALIGLIGIGSICGRFVLTAIGDALGRARVLLSCCAALAASMLIWATAGTMLELRIFALIFGACHGAFIALLPSAVADRFGSHMLGTVIGVLYTSRAIALFAGPPVVAEAIAFSGSKVVPLVGVAALGALGVVLLGRALGTGLVPSSNVPSPPARPSPRPAPYPDAIAHPTASTGG